MNGSMIMTEATVALARNLLMRGKPEDGPFDVDALWWLVNASGTPEPLALATELIDYALALYDREQRPWRAGNPASVVCYGSCSLPSFGCSFDFGNGAMVTHVPGGWSVTGTGEDTGGTHADRTAAERIARRAATLAAIANRIERRRRAEELAQCAPSDDRSDSTR